MILLENHLLRSVSSLLTLLNLGKLFGRYNLITKTVDRVLSLLSRLSTYEVKELMANQVYTYQQSSIPEKYLSKHMHMLGCILKGFLC